MSKFLDYAGLSVFKEQIENQTNNKITEATQNKVDKVEGKGLSTNDYTNEEKSKLAGIAENANNYTHPESGVTAGTYTTVTVDSYGHVTVGSEKLDASKIEGKISIENIPHGALERLVIVKNDEARFALTTEQIQTGDTVKVESDQKMYFVVDDTKLNSEDGYEVYTVGVASAVDWANVLNKINASESADGLMSSSDYTKLKGIEEGANNYVHPTDSGNKHIPAGGTIGQFLKNTGDGTLDCTDWEIPTYSEATTTEAGLMSASDKTKLDGITSITSEEINALFA